MDPPDRPPRPSGPEYDPLVAELARLREQLVESEARAAAARDALLVDNETLESHRLSLEHILDSYADLYDFAPIAYLALDAAGVVQDINPTATTFLQTERVRMLGRPLRLHVAPDDRRTFLDHMVRCRRSHDQVVSELRVLVHDGREIPVQVISRRAGVAEDGLTYHTVLVDLSERLAAEDALRRSHQRLALAVEASGAGLYESTWPAGDLVVNAGWARILGYDPALLPPSHLLADWLRQQIDPVDLEARDASLLSCLAAGPSYAAEFRVRHAGGRWVWVREFAEIADRDPTSIYLVGVLVDVTAEKLRLAEARERSDQLQSLAEALFRVEENERRELATQLHDDLGQRLVAVKLRLAVADQDSVRPALELLDQVQDTVRSLAFQLSPPILRDLGLVAGLRWLAREFQAAYALPVEVESDDLPPLHADRIYLLFRCVRELLLNTVKHARARSARVVLTADADHVRISVEDDGAGFDAAARAAPSRSFGLLSVRERVGWLGGQVTIISAPGEGTLVTLAVPLASAAPG